MAEISRDSLVGQLRAVLREGFEGPPPKWSYFLDQGATAGLLPLAESISAAAASRPSGPGGTTIAAHVHHLAFSLGASRAWISGDQSAQDWASSWSVSTVDDAAWARERAELRRQYEGLDRAIADADLTNDETLGGAVGAIAHAAYHVGAVRQKVAAASSVHHFLEEFEREYARTLRVLQAFPADQLDFKPHPTSQSARDLAFIFERGQGLILKALTTGFDWSVPPSQAPKPPDTLPAIIESLEAMHRRVVDLLRATTDAQLEGTVRFFVAPKTLGDWPKLQFLWMSLHDSIHHRGQLSVYLRMVGGKVPSIYGPSRDEPWR